MRSVLAVFGIAILAIAAALAFGKHKDLVENPQILADKKAAEKQADDQKAAVQAAAKGGSQSAPTPAAPPPAPAPSAAAVAKLTQGAIPGVISVKGRGDIAIEL